MKTILSFLFAFAVMVNSFGQDAVIRIKFKANKATDLQLMDSKPRQFSKEGYVQTGIAGLDKLTARYHVAKLKRVFRPAGKFEARHQKFGLNLWYEMDMGKLSASEADQSVVDFKKLDEVEIVEKNSDKQLLEVYGNIAQSSTFIPNDPRFGDQWHYHNTGQTGGTVGSDIKLPEAWTIQKGSGNVTVAVIDMGIDIHHEDLAGAIWVNQAEKNGVAGVDDDNNGYVDDINGYCFGDNTGTIPAGNHGSHVAGTIGAVTNNGIGVSGIAGGSGSADGVKLMSCAVFGQYNQNGFGEAFVYAADMGASIAQNSWGYTSEGDFEQDVHDGIDYFIANAGIDIHGNQTGPMAGGLVVFAAGNSSSNGQWYPGYYDHVLSVAALDHNSQITWYSNYGTWVDISAPGGNTTNSLNQGVLSTTPGNTYSYFQGTSMACPHVSGVAALVVSQFQGAGLTPQFVWDRIIEGADSIDNINPGYAGQLGSGRLNAFKAVSPVDTIPPAAISNLNVVNHDQISITLSWTATGGSGSIGKAALYEIRRAEYPINNANFASATLVLNALIPKMAGEQESFKVAGLTPGKTYYFAIKVMDLDKFKSGLSNVVSSATDPAPIISITPASLVNAMDSGLTTIDTLAISNIGDGILNFNFADFGLSAQQNQLKNNTAFIKFNQLPAKGDKDTRVGHPVVTGKGNDGPDGFGYSWIDSREVGGPTFSWTDISGFGTLLNSGDDFSQLVTLPFGFKYYGQTYNSVYISSNGFLTFNMDGSSAYSNTQLPDAGVPNAILAAFWDDLYINNNLYYYGDANGFIVQYQNVQGLGEGNSLTFEIILKPNGDIKYQYKTMTGDLISATTGIENQTGTDGLQVAFNTSYISDNLAVSFSTKPAFIKSITPVSGAVNSGNKKNVLVEISAIGMQPNNYSDEISIVSNDPLQPKLDVPVFLHINGTPKIEVTPDTLNFGQVFIIDTAQLKLCIINTGTDSLHIDSLTTGNGIFFVKNFKPVTIYSKDTFKTFINFAPHTTANLAQNLVIYSNAVNSGAYAVHLTGHGVLPPVITVQPDSLNAELFTEDSAREALTIGNIAGGSDLIYSIEITYQNKDTSAIISKSNIDLIGKNVTKNKANIPLFSKKQCFNSNSEKNILVLEAGVVNDYYNQAFENLGYSRTLVTDIYTFYNQLTGGVKWDMVVVNNYDYDISPDVLDSLNSYAKKGGLLIFASWDLEYYSTSDFVTNTLGVNYLQTIFTPIDFHSTQPEHSIFNQPNKILNLKWSDDQGERDGQITEPQAGFNALAEFDNIPGSGSIIINSKNKTIFNAFQAENYNRDDDADGKMDMLELIENEISFLSNSGGWLKPDVAGGTIHIDTTENLSFKFDAKGLFGGDYYARIDIKSNDPIHHNIGIPSHLHVIGRPIINISSDTLNFGKVFTGYSDTLHVTLRNSGTDLLLIDSMVISDPHFDISKHSLIINYNDSAVIKVWYKANELQSDLGTLSIYSNDTIGSTRIVILKGESIPPPVISITPDSIREDLFSGEKSKRTFTIYNNGGSDLTYSISTKELEVSQVSIFADNSIKEAKVIATGKPIKDLNQLKIYFPKQKLVKSADIIDKNAAFTQKLSQNGALNQVAGEEVFGSAQNEYYGGPRSRGNLFTCTSSTNLVEHRLYIGPTPNTEVWFLVYEGQDQVGTYNMISASELTPTASTIGWYSSGKINVKLLAGKYYLIIASFESPATYYNEYVSSAFPVPASFGELTAGAGADWVPSSYFPPDTIQDVPSYAFGSAVDYYQTLVTSRGPLWLSTDTTSGTIPAGSSADIEVIFDATDLYGGDYNGNIVIASNDPVHSQVIEPVHLHVTGRPIINVTPDTINFGQVFTGYTDTLNVTVKNNGTDLLVIDSMLLTDSHFGVGNYSNIINCKDSTVFKVWYKPNEIQSDKGILYVFSNDSLNSTLSIVLEGKSVIPPVMTVSPDSFGVELFTGEKTIRELTISNAAGRGDLKVNIDRLYQQSPSFRESDNLIIQSSSLKNSVLDGKLMRTRKIEPIANNIVKNKNAIKVLIIHDNYCDISEIYGILEAYADLDVYSCTEDSVPILENLMNYSNVIICNSYPWNNSIALGDELADYADAGHHIIVTPLVFYNSSSYNIQGRFLTERYNPFTMNDYFIWDVLGEFDPNNSIMKDVSYIYCSIINNLDVITGATKVASMANGGALVGTKGNVIALNVYISFPGYWQGDVPTLFHNAIVSNMNWVNPEHNAATIASGTSNNVNIHFDATGLNPGNYYASISVSGNDPVNPETIVPAHLHVKSTRPIVLEGNDTIRMHVSDATIHLVLDNFFSSPTGSKLTYTQDITIIDHKIATTVINSYLLTVDPVAVGKGILKITAKNDMGETTDKNIVLIIDNDVLVNEISQSGFYLNNYPNPFDGTTNICYNLNKPAYIEVRIYSLQGQLLNTLANEYENEGQKVLKFNANSYKPGVYIYELKIDGSTAGRNRMIIE